MWSVWWCCTCKGKSMCMPWRQTAGKEVWFHLFLTSALMVASGLLHTLVVSPPLLCRKRPRTHWKGGRNGPRPSLEVLVETKMKTSCPCLESHHDSFSVYPVTVLTIAGVCVCLSLLHKKCIPLPLPFFFKWPVCTPKKIYYLGSPQPMSLWHTRNAHYLGSPQAISSVQKSGKLPHKTRKMWHAILDQIQNYCR